MRHAQPLVFLASIVLCLAGTGPAAQAGLSMTIGTTSNASASVDFSGTINFTNGAGNVSGSVVNYQANSLVSSATFNYTSFDGSTTYPSIERIVEQFTNNTGRSLSALTISLSGTTQTFRNGDGSPSYIPMINNSFPATVTVAGTPPPAATRTVTNTTTQTASFTYNSSYTSITIRFNSGLANGASFNYYAPLVTNTSFPSGTLTFTETAIVSTPEPASLVSAFFGALGLAGFSLTRSAIRRRQGVLTQV